MHVAAFFAGPVMAAAIIGGAASGFAFVTLSTLLGAAMGAVAGGVSYRAAGLGTFDKGALEGAMAGAIGGFIGALAYSPIGAAGKQQLAKGHGVGIPGRSYYYFQDWGGSLNNGVWKFDQPTMDGNWFYHFYEYTLSQFVPRFPLTKMNKKTN